jgi:hypothetical protein
VAPKRASHSRPEASGQLVTTTGEARARRSPLAAQPELATSRERIMAAGECRSAAMGVACPSFACRLLCCVKCVSSALKVGDARGWHTQRSRNSPRRRCVQVGFAARYFWIARSSWVSAAPSQSILSSHRLWNLFPAPLASPPLPRPQQRAPRAQHTLDKPASPSAATHSHLDVVAARSSYARSPCRLSLLACRTPVPLPTSAMQPSAR